MAEASRMSQVPNKKRIAIWTLPHGSSPAVRVEIANGKIISNRLLQIVFDTLGIQERSRGFFSLFKGLEPPTRKFGDEEIIYVPCQYVISVQKWSFDPVEEARCIKTDVPSLRLLAMQVKADIAVGRLKTTLEERKRLDEYMDPEFPSFKQYVEYARSMRDYGTIVVKGVTLIKNLSLKTQMIKKGNKIDIACNSKKMIIITERKELHIPWRKVRRWTQVSGHTTLGYEIYLMEAKAFTWIEIDSNQAPYLLQVTSELIARLNERLKKAEFKRPAWAQGSSPPRTRLTWKLFKKEVFGIGRGPEPEPVFDNFEEETSSSDEDEERFGFGSRQPPRSKSAAAYVVTGPAAI